MSETDDRIRLSMRLELARRNWTAAELGRHISLNRQGISDLMTTKTGRIPPRLLQALDTLGLELVAVPKDHTPQP